MVSSWVSCPLGPHSVGCARGAGAISSRLSAFLSGPVPAPCCGHCPHPALRVEAGGLWHQSRLWPVWLPAEEQRPCQVRESQLSINKTDSLEMICLFVNSSYVLCYVSAVFILKLQVLSLEVFQPFCQPGYSFLEVFIKAHTFDLTNLTL